MSNDKRIQFGTLATNSRWTGKEWLNVPPGCIVAAWQKFSSIPRMTRMEEYVITTFAETLNEKEEFKRMLNAIYNLASNRRATKQLYDVWERCKKNFEQYKHAHRLHDRSAVIAADVLTFKKGVENDVR